eukprot:132654-Hanusia_phi.AAC.4
MSEESRPVPDSSDKRTAPSPNVDPNIAAFEALLAYRPSPPKSRAGEDGLSAADVINRCIQAYMQGIADRKSPGVRALRDGALPLSMQEYTLLCENMRNLWSRRTCGSTETDRSDWIFGWCYTVLLWNLIARSEDVDSIRLGHIGWENDCLKMILPPDIKSHDRAGRDIEKHIFASPCTPEICPILVLGLYVFCTRVDSRQQHMQASSKLFVGSEEQQRYVRLLSCCIASAKEQHRGSLDKASTCSFRNGGIAYLFGALDVTGELVVSHPEC